MAEPETLLQATDQDIENALVYADTMVLRGLLYQLTGDEDILRTEVTATRSGFLEVQALAHPEDGATLRKKAAELAKSLRDRQQTSLDFGPRERLQSSLELTAGQTIPERDVAMWTEELGLDPEARGLKWPTTPSPDQLQDFEVLVIGAGMSGLNAAIQLKNAGIAYSIVEKNADLGGTWQENRYPGARVDTPSRGYCHVYGADFIYPYPFSPQSDNLRYLQWIAERFGVQDTIEFRTEVTSLIWHDDVSLWEASLVGPNGPEVRRYNAVISAVGFLSRPNIPTLPGQGEFQGEIVHTATWRDDLDIAGKRVAIIGSGCSGYQALAEIAKSASHTYLFQREPSWVYETAGYLSPYPSEINWLERNFPYYRNFLRFRSMWMFGPETLGRVFLKDRSFNDAIREERLAFMQKKFANRPDLMTKMLPSTPPMTSRPVLVDENWSVYDVLVQENSDLVTENIEKLTANGILDVTGTEHAVDVIVLATGFRANDFLFPMDIRGKGGMTLSELWSKDGARAYLGTMLPGFPNLFTLYGPNINSAGGGGNPAIQESQTRFILNSLAHLVLHDLSRVEVTDEAYAQYNNELDDAEAAKIYVGSDAKNYYMNEYGRSAANCPFDIRKMWEWLRDPSGQYTCSAPGTSMNADSKVKPYFGQDLVAT
ncbi:NAD(P)/FAD-dependent oxidoreductase [Mycolicibacterium sp. CBMA 226]|uniref:flavin-containing monooxygenase n=1 Tax=Mycolicibacterium sp. CBMA 226 TaxID=2606611 RepID=UPI001AA0CC5F|nr:NAD(P)/FAD-dependent oxidoreductase [Mycolicibacterium sp. CBMA 226]